MARKGNQQRNGVDRHTSNHKRKVSDSRRAPDMKRKGETSEVNALHGEEIPNGNQPTGLHKTYHAGDENKINENSGTVPREKKPSIDEVRNLEESVLFGSNSQDPSGEPPGVREENGTPISGSDRSGLGHLFNTSNIKSMMENVVLSGDVLRNLRASALSILQVVGEWMERHEPVFGTLKGKIYSGRDFVMSKIEKAYPIALKWLTQFGNIVLLLLMVWLDCTLRGVDSFLRLGTTSFLTILWCTILSVIAMVGMPTFLIVLAIAAFVGVFIGLILGLLAMAIAGFIFLWSYGSFWTTLSLIVIGGLAFILSHERLALFITTVYSMYSVWSYLGLTGLLLALNLSFVTSDILIYFLKNNINQQRRSNRHADQSAGMEGRPGFFSGQSFHPSSPEAGTGASAERSSGAPSTSGVDAELTSEDEVTRLLNCTDHYSVLGLSRFENVDISLLKKEYRKKAMLVHPDKNMGNEKAAEAFKKLQNAYEVLIDSAKQKAYDDELRSEELLNYFRRFQSTSQKNGEHGFFASRFARSGADGEDPFEESRRIACKKCGNFHLWFHTKKSKARARWCQDCKDFHQAKDGDGWVEQSSQPFLFGLLQKVDAPSAYVCADSKIYDATEWYICQGMRCPANTHKPSFHVNTSVTSKHNSSKGSSSGQRSGQMPASNMEETMTEEELFEWLQNAMQSGVFENFNGSTSADSPTGRAGNGPRSAAGSSGSGSNNKKKKKGKKQW